MEYPQLRMVISRTKLVLQKSEHVSNIFSKQTLFKRDLLTLLRHVPPQTVTQQYYNSDYNNKNNIIKRNKNV